ncbi:MAG: tRNA epoxyqueuosine(34) reductase QueG [Acidobacteria bacterium]|nr:tRNA epoxyqueuosine(34) reductase QueG [Acidobacteriota bacterium]
MLSTAWVIEQGRALGFDRVGVAPADEAFDLDRISAWLDRGYAGEMDYLKNPKRRDACPDKAGARALLPSARSVICCALVYDTSHPRSTETPPDPERGWVSRYAWGDDYHLVMEEKLEVLRDAIAAQLRKSESGEDKAEGGATSPDTGHRTPDTAFHCKLYVDTGPILERAYAARAGLGWQGKNTCLLDPELGSFFFLGLLVTNLALEPTAPQADGCGACTLCLDACPTNALVEPYVLDARRCISYLTIELRGPIPEDLRAPMGRHVFGCDICQDVCPYNRRAIVSDLAAFQPRRVAPTEPRGPITVQRENCPKPVARSPLHEPLFHPSLEWLAALSESDFREVFKDSALKRAKHRGLLRNTIVAMGNSRNPRFRPILESLASSSDALLADHARWALTQLQ